MYVGILMDDERPPRRHITLTFHEHNETFDQYKRAVAATALAAARWPALIGPFKIRFDGLGIFEPSGAWHTKVVPDRFGIMLFQQTLTMAMDHYDVRYSKEYDYVPHVTLSYFKKPELNPFEGLTIVADTISVVSNEFGNTNIRL